MPRSGGSQTSNASARPNNKEVILWKDPHARPPSPSNSEPGEECWVWDPVRQCWRLEPDYRGNPPDWRDTEAWEGRSRRKKGPAGMTNHISGNTSGAPTRNVIGMTGNGNNIITTMLGSLISEQDGAMTWQKKGVSARARDIPKRAVPGVAEMEHDIMILTRQKAIMASTMDKTSTGTNIIGFPRTAGRQTTTNSIARP